MKDMNMNEDMFASDGLFVINGIKIHDYVQPVTSAETCRNQKAAGARILTEIFDMPMRVLDFGGGKYSEAQEYLQSLGAVCEVYDPYNRSYEENVNALSQKYDLMMCNNVLNVLNDDVIMNVIRDMQKVAEMCEVKKIVVTVYERDRSGVGCQTGEDSYQRNEKTSAYVDKLRCFLGISFHKKALVVHV
jgi:hypothetical protein